MSSKKLGDYRKDYDNSQQFYQEGDYKITDYGVLDDHTSNIIKNKQYIFENVKNQELLELEEEEEYLNRIRNEKQQVENMQREFSSYQSLIQNLQHQLEKYQKYKPYYEKYQSIKQLLEKTLSKLESKETENQILQNQISSLKDERDHLLQKQIEIQKEKTDLTQYVTKCDQLNAQISEVRIQFQREFSDKEKQFLKDLNLKQQYETKLKDELAQTQCKLEEAMIQIKRLKEDNQQIGLKQDSYEEKYQATQQKLIECLKELDKSKEQINRLSFEVQQKRIEIAECQEIKRQLSSNANILKRQEILFEELKTSKAEDDQRIQLLQDELDLKEKELNRSKQLNMKLSEEYDGCVHKIVEFERELAVYRKENHELKRNLSILMEKQQNEKAYKEEVNRVKQDLYNIRNTELDKFNSVFDYIMSPQSNLNKSKN
ncbi:hypothetical protein TTHERM_00251100 (macronuclear) [Tetrahymena thermophila SB210]|uniref:Uncharacterized protein n=1 Tax=Tetrahymena thermophila (strain SB210) TaxID=312017 RepID=Q23QS3_TETTS|nr:hypothetical protein TTHERM_00251100 [Tetrahymena thermophila SB210]EAR98815.2 hypothetical protein TTHERM_00251100 [Tetrahymena thermophila SB210]|eukprot:XP_001019060.2 hypothetical protein TTHERM_00251100 [Tetrahymena thermophila SB210]